MDCPIGAKSAKMDEILNLLKTSRRVDLQADIDCNTPRLLSAHYKTTSLTVAAVELR
ncbi:hypothetical protein HBI56_080810 [Parastagonospora nodorum]|uniref:Uncharacterized protein n=1 Tax=Phaeosphaeria nodorum (strain SN15 / ATCC MYA-4574 / FGSC 10173) TaxID=321614 RepID=A0A7U2I7D4_PHANO|nr:hypothetical protein HBH56_105890 [Parastagonospora nodorum]QRD04790.1 hypothetical protein JI435_421700 [Parastagonospora nodorum SN15]KAH3929416.1 hypothetical protein HBH54_124520 [Parastagonospora nodorum]KAH3999280.1 hypothetical protein HBI10_121750 [Parastagonospora nodorum]KAH4024952.1 hypothetical protein HBI13_075430 [Parastagonospora nodorum]